MIKTAYSHGRKQCTNDGCFLIGSGTSLKAVDVAQLVNVDTISFNRSYVAWKQWGFAPTCYACLDPIVFEDNTLEIRQLIKECPRTRFFLPEAAACADIKTTEQVSFVKISSGNTFANDIATLTDFGNVGATSIQILALLGYRRIAMVGIDARYNQISDNVLRMDKDGFALLADDPNHFCFEYAQGQRQRVHPDLEKIIGRWPQVAKECVHKGIEVRNASLGSALGCFPITDFAAAIEWVAGRERLCGDEQNDL